METPEAPLGAMKRVMSKSGGRGGGAGREGVVTAVWKAVSYKI